MTSEELLLKMSDLLESKLEKHLEGLEERLAGVENRLEGLEERLEGLGNRLENLEGRLENLEERLNCVGERLGCLEERTARLEGEVLRLKERMDGMEENVIYLKLQSENVIVPRLQTIEECYTSTYQRYKDGIISMERVQTDVDVLKSVVSDHSFKLRNIS